MRHTSIILALVTLLGVALTSCAPDPIYSYPPEYERTVKFTKDDPKTITLDNQEGISFVTSCQAGDSITAFVRVSYTGAYITKATYYWTLRDFEGEKVSERKVEQVAPNKQTALPMWNFVAPNEPGTYYVHFRAYYKYSAQAENGALYGGYPTNADYEGASTVRVILTVK